MREKELMKAANRYEVLIEIEHGVLKVVEAPKILGLSKRQIQRLRRRVEKDGQKR